MAGLEDLATGIAIDFKVGGFDVLAKLPKMLDAASASSDKLTLSVKGLGDAFTSLVSPVKAASGGIADFTVASTGAAAASRAAASAHTAAASGVTNTGRAYRQATRDVEAFRVAVAATSPASSANMLGGSTARSRALASGVGPIAIGGAEQLALSGGARMVNVTPGRAGSAGFGGFGGAAGGGGGGFGGGVVAAAAGGGGGGAFGALTGLGVGLAGRGMPLLAQAGKAGLDFGIHAAKIGAEAGLGVAIDGLYEASKMQTLMLGVGNSTGASKSQMRFLQQSAYDVGDLTGMSANEAAKGMVNIARASGGVFRNKDGTFDMAGLNAIVPTVMSAAQIQHITRGTNVDEAATTMMEVVHLFRDFKGTPFNKLADLMTRLSEASPTSMNAAMRQFTSFEPQFKTLGISDTDAVASYAMMARAGYGSGKGGTNINALIAGALPALEMTRHAQSGKLGLLEKYGFVDPATGKSKFFTNDKADLMGFYENIAHLGREYSRDDLVSSFRSMFGERGGRIANLVEDAQINSQLTGLKALMNDPHISLKNQFKGYQNTFGFQAGRAGGDFQSLTGELMTSTLQGLTGGFRDLGNAMHGAQRYLHEHRDIELRIQHDVTAAVKGTESFIVSHKQDFATLGTNLMHLGSAAIKSGPALATAATAVLDFANVSIPILTAGINTINNILHFRGNSDELAPGVMPSAPSPNQVSGSRFGSVPLGLPMPAGRQAGPTVVYLTQHFHGPTTRANAAAAGRAAAQAFESRSGAHVTVPNKPLVSVLRGY